MKIDLNAKIADAYGRTYSTTGSDGAARDMVLRDIIETALNNGRVSEGLAGGKIIARAAILLKVAAGDEVDLSPEQVADLRDAVEKHLSGAPPMLLLRAMEMTGGLRT